MTFCMTAFSTHAQPTEPLVRSSYEMYRDFLILLLMREPSVFRGIQFKVDRLQIIIVAKKYLLCNCSSVGCLKCVQFHSWFRLH